MRVEYICHACLLIDTGTAKLVTDPWITGPAYCGQWHLFPRPVEATRARDADVILISHGHEDHMHDQTLRGLAGRASVVYPYYWYGGARAYLRSMGFASVRELATFHPIEVAPGVRVTYVSNYLDTIMVVESGGRVLVDLNDALHASHPNVIDIFVRAIRRRWPRIDVAFCGFGGAHYFPNSVHVEGKDDVGVGRLREQLFLHNFCRIVHGLSPGIAVPFAADFALLDPGKMWINRTRFPRERIAAYYREHFGDGGASPRIVTMYPGDVLDGDELIASSPYRADVAAGRLADLIEVQYRDEIERRRSVTMIDEADAERLGHEMRANVMERRALFPAERLANLVFSVRVRDVAARNCYDVSFEGGVPVVRRAEAPPADAALVIETHSTILRYGWASEWGGDAMLIGYGWEVFMRDRSAVRNKLDAVCLRLLTRIPSAKQHMLKKEPARALRYVAGNPLTRKWVGQYLLHRSKQRAIYDQDLWLSRTKCEVCQACDIPLLDDAFSSQLA
jgi:Beta-lactamase superfamily domain